MTGGPFPEKIDNLMASMRGDRTDAELFASLPKRLTGVIHIGPPGYKPEDYPQNHRE